jgi:hypothetical protein
MLTPRSLAHIESEVSAIAEYCERVFGVSIDLHSFRNLVEETLMDKVEDYIFQRIRDWPVKDLIALEKALRAVIATQVNPTPPETTRERKRAKAH